MKLQKTPFKGITLLEAKEIPTPFGGSMETPILELPPIGLPELDERKRKVVAHALGIDASALVNLIPYVGSVIGDGIRAAHTREIKKLLTDKEFDRYTKWDKTYPDFFAALRSFMEI
jgi:hypothetical protein